MNPQDSMKHTGAWEVRRRIKIPALVHDADAMAVERAVKALSGVRQVVTNVDKHRVVVRYDASRLAYHAIVDVMENTGFPPSGNWWNRLKSIWFQFTDTNASENAKAPPAACCNKTPK